MSAGPILHQHTHNRNKNSPSAALLHLVTGMNHSVASPSAALLNFIQPSKLQFRVSHILPYKTVWILRAQGSLSFYNLADHTINRDPLLIGLGRGFTFGRFEEPTFETNSFVVFSLKGGIFCLKSEISWWLLGIFSECHSNLTNPNHKNVAHKVKAIICLSLQIQIWQSNKGMAISAENKEYILKSWMSF